jgi:hypothetical protein
MSLRKPGPASLRLLAEDVRNRDDRLAEANGPRTLVVETHASLAPPWLIFAILIRATPVRNPARRLKFSGA